MNRATVDPEYAGGASTDADSADFDLLVILLRHVESAWAFALFEDIAIRGRVIAALRDALAPLPVIEQSLAGSERDLLALLQQTDDEHAAVICLTGLDNAIRDGWLPRYLDLQRDLLARRPQRLIFWLRDAELHALANAAPNFYSRISGVYHFYGTVSNGAAVPQPDDSYRVATRSVEMPTSAFARRSRKRIPARDEPDRERLAAQLERRIADLQRLPRPDSQTIGDSYYDLGGLYDNIDLVPYRWADAQAAYAEAGRWYAQANRLSACAEALALAGEAAYRAYDLQAAEEYLRRALILYRQLEDAGGEANTRKAMGDVQQFRKDMDAALDSYRQALALFQAVGSRLGEANTRKAMGDVQQFRKDMDAALDSYRQALDLYQAVGSKLGEANTRQAMGDVQQFRKDMDAALDSYRQALALFQAVGDRLGEATTRRAIGDVQQFRADRDAALDSYRQALALYQAVGSKLGEANTLAAQSCLLIDGDPAQSQVLLEHALTIRRSLQDVYSEGADLGNYAIALLQRGRNGEALPYLQRARDLFASRGLQAQVEQMDQLIAQASSETPQPPSLDDILTQFEPLLQAISAVAQGDQTDKAEVEAALTHAEAHGWRIADATRRLWHGERDVAALTAGLDVQDTALVRRVLVLVAEEG